MFTTPLFPHINSISRDFAPLFRLLESATADVVPASRRIFTPRFDVRELGAAYELQGELPGIEQKDLEIEFVDERTLVIRGRIGTESTAKMNEQPQTLDTAVPSMGAISESASAKSNNTNDNDHKASVEDDYVDAGAGVSEAGEGIQTPTSTNAEVTPATDTKRVTEPNFKYWVSERSIGTFERRFSFPGRLNQDAVKASLKNGILSVVVPKVIAQEARKIAIE